MITAPVPDRLHEQMELFIDGEWRRPHSSLVIESINPASEEVWARVPAADDEDVDDAVQAAAAALRGPWGSMSPTDRGRLIAHFAESIRSNAGVLAEWESTDNGKPIRDTRREVAGAADWLAFYAGAADKINGSTIPYRRGALAYTVREPVGVVAAITPWNSPINMYAWKLGPALAAGNTVVLKPSQLTPVTALQIAAIAADVGFPPGVINVITGTGEKAGQALVRHPLVNKIAFTGEHSTAGRIMAAAGDSLKRISLECGGKSPNIVFRDANIPRAVTVATHAAFRSTGQSCSIGSRLLVQEDAYEEVLNAVIARTQAIRIGPPLDEETQIGPHTSQQQLDKTLRYIDIGKESGRLMHGGGRPPGLPKGYYIEPTVFADVPNTTRLAQEEVFGPVLVVIPFRDEDDAVAIANGVKYGLVAGIWTDNVGRAHRVASQLESGFISVNTYRPVHYMLPYGGYKYSGLGRENGLEVLHEYTELKTVVVNLDDTDPPDPFGA